ncbi:LysR substrate-binding domain-containing protein [uncultured Herbaspirillum sp.]|jgi:LysR family glycine cleavage system transcriptional activator|uniref:LysR substrate-binding domain-containing protein n=1 Tax=uncultured Herbaspirillum sp. TaxID=160236 RepID=UPI002590D4AE|nr:LysR substrate-binding domain-containing protein [uncultured Herbaspirillum sp.]
MKLPPLTTIRVFDATARHLSVKLAAEELHVTPGAVTQQIKKLEAFLGQGLFERRARGLSLTAQGRDYQLACEEALTVLGRATDKLMTVHQRVILVSCTAGFAAQWLVPRLQNFMRDAGAIDVHVSTTNRKVDLVNESIDFAVRHGLGNYPGLKSKVLLADDLIPVCSPRLIAPRRSARMEGITDDLLLHDEHREDWRLWCEAAAIPRLKCNAGIVFVNSNAVIEAALSGRGYALVRPALVLSELASGQLLAVKAPKLRTPLAYHLVYRPETLIDPVSRKFFDWIVAQAQGDTSLVQ